jgi:hypothetical protein
MFITGPLTHFELAAESPISTWFFWDWPVLEKDLSFAYTEQFPCLVTHLGTIIDCHMGHQKYA